MYERRGAHDRRWLDEPRVQAALSPTDRSALENLCARLPELLPDKTACLTHGDLWAQNVLSTADGQPALIDPAVSYMWAEVDLAHLWTTGPPPEARVFFDRYAELTDLDRDCIARHQDTRRVAGQCASVCHETLHVSRSCVPPTRWRGGARRRVEFDREGGARRP